MKSTKMNWLLGAVAATALLAGCNSKKGAEEAASEVAVNAEEQLEAIQVRAGNPGRAEEALAAMGLDASGAGPLSFADKSVDGASANYSNLSVDLDGAGLTIGTMSFTGLDMTDAGAQFGSLKISDITISPEDASEGGMTISGLELINPSPELAAFVAAMVSGDDMAEPPAFEQISFDAATLSNFKLTVNDGSEDVAIDLGDFKLLGFSPTGMDLLQFSGINADIYNSYDETRVKVTLDNFAVTGVKESLMAIVTEGMEDSMGSGSMGESFMQGFSSGMYGDPTDPGFDNFVMSGLSFDGEGVGFSLPSLQAAVTRNKDGKPTKYVTRPFTATLSADAEGGEWGAELAGGLGMLGYETLEFSGEGVTTFDPANDTATYETGKFALKDGFAVDFTGKFGGLKAYGDTLSALDATAFETDPSAMMDAFSKLTLYDMKFVLKDDSIVDRLINLAAAQSGEDPAALRNQIVAMAGMAPMMAAQSGVDPELATEVSTAISKFIQDPGTLTIQLKPKSPITATTFSSPEEITKSALGLTAKAE